MGARPEFESSPPCIKILFPKKGFFQGYQLSKVLKKQHEGVGQHSSSERQEGYAKICETILSGGKIFEGGLPLFYSASSRNSGRKKKKKTEREKKDAVSKDKMYIWLFLSLHLTSRNSSLICAELAGGISMDSVIIYRAFIALAMFRTFYINTRPD